MKKLHERPSPDEHLPITAEQLMPGGGKRKPIQALAPGAVSVHRQEPPARAAFTEIEDQNTRLNAMMVEDFVREKCKTVSEMRLVLTAVLFKLTRPS